MIGGRTGNCIIAAIIAALAGVDASHQTRGQDGSIPSAKTPVAAAPVSARCQRSEFRVLVDVGHTADVPGAISAHGVPEYDFNLHLGQDIKQALTDAGFDKTTLLITSTAPPDGLFERAHAANAMRANLFIAIHHDSVPDSLLQTWDYDGQQLSYNDQYPGYAIFISNDNADRAGSLAFGRFLGKELKQRGLHYTPHYTLSLMGARRRELLDADAGVYRYDQLVVLRAAHMPAVLFEAGSIINRTEELELATPERRALTSAAVAAAVEDFCAARAHPERGRFTPQQAAAQAPTRGKPEHDPSR
jgi:N-acetylmuramoyl-L-alanine amidase